MKWGYDHQVAKFYWRALVEAQLDRGEVGHRHDEQAP